MTLLLAALLAFQPAPAPTSGEIAAAVAALATAPAVRTGNTVQETPTLPPPPPSTSGPPAFDATSANGRCVGAEPLLAYYSPGWSVTRMSGIMYRESRCDPNADNPHSSASGLLQLLSSLHCGWLAKQLGPCDLYDPAYNIQAAALLWQQSGYGAWVTS